MMKRPPSHHHARPPPPTVKPNELRRQQIRSYDREGALSPKGMFHPASPFQTISSSHSISRSFSTCSIADGPDVDNSDILRGAQILRQQFLKQSQTATYSKNKGTVTQAPERLFPSENDEAITDLLGIQATQSPKGANNVLQDWTDPWRPSAFDPAYQTIRDQRQEILYGELHQFPALPPIKEGRETPLKKNTSKPTTTPPLPANTNWKAKPRFDLPASVDWKTKPHIFQKEDADDLPSWATPSEQSDTNETGTKLADEIAKYRQAQDATPLSQELALMERESPGKGPAKAILDDRSSDSETSDIIIPSLPNPWLERANNTDSEAFDNFIDSVSLDSKDNDRVALSERRQHPWDKKESAWGKAKKKGSQRRHHRKESRDQPPKKQAVSFTMPITIPTRRRRGGRGRRPQRSYSSSSALDMTMEKKPSHRRARSMERRQNTHNTKVQSKTSLRNDLLCGIDTNCKTDLTPEQEELMRAELMEYWTGQNRSGRSRKRGKHKDHKSKKYASFSSSLQVVVSEGDKFDILAPDSDYYQHLQTDPAFQHAVNAGSLWQALVGSHVRFPKHWWQGHYRTAPLGCPKQLAAENKWVYYDRHRIKGNKFLNHYVKRRDDPGKILLHLVVRDFMTSCPILDIAIGCFHPNAKSIRVSELPNKRLEDCRDVWMATRFRTKDMVSVIDPGFLEEKFGKPRKTPLGDSKRRISNANVRAIFGESPPLWTSFVLESDIYEQLTSVDDFDSPGPVDAMLQKYVFRTSSMDYRASS